MARLCEIAKAFLKQRAIDLIHNARGSPVLAHYSCDGTPLSTKLRIRAGGAGGFSAHAEGRHTEEFLVQHCYYRSADALGKASTTVMIRDPLPLTQGKTSAAIFSAGKEFCQTVRQHGHTGVSVSHYTFDRGLYSALQRMYKQHHQLLAPQFSAPAEGKDSNALSLLEWTLASPCGIHDCHNALKWSMHRHFLNTELMNDVFIVVASARNSFGLLLGHLAGWIQSRLALIPDDQLPPTDDRAQLWTALGAEPDLVELLAHELRLQWQDGQLQVAASRGEDGDLLEKLSGALLGLWRFKQYCTSRWVTVGTSCRSLAAARLSGFDDLVSCVRAGPQASDFHIHGYEKFTRPAKQFVAIAALSSYVSEGCLLALLKDNRVALRARELEETMLEELAFLTNLGEPLWIALGDACGMAPGQLRSEVISAAHVSMAFFSMRTLAEAKKLPWSLGVGDKDKNLDELAAGPRPAEPVSAKIWHLVRLGFSRPQLKQALELVMDCPWGTASAEQQHASATLFKKFHPEYGMETLMLRSMLHSFRLLLPGAVEGEKQLASQLKRVQVLMAKKPERISGRHLFVKDLVGEADSWRQDKRKHMPTDVQKVIFKRHGARWATMGAKTKERYKARAAIERSSSQHALEEQLEEERERANLLRSRLQAQLAERSPLMLSACRLTAEEMHTMGQMFANPEFKNKTVTRLREMARVAPPPPTAEVQEAMRNIPVYQDKVLLQRPSWLSPMCWHRAFFQRCALQLDTGEGKAWFRFLYATQSPLFAVFCEMQEEDHYLDMVQLDGSNWDSVGAQHYDYRFAMDFKAVRPWHELPQVAEDAIHVLMDMHFLPGNSLASASEPVPLKVVLSWLPAPSPSTPREQQPSKLSPAAQAEILANHPFLRRFVETQSDPSSSSQSQTCNAEQEVPKDPATITDEQLQEVFDAMEQKRQEWAHDEVGYDGEFKITLIGGPWLMKKRGEAFHAWRGAVRQGSPAEQWCAQYSMPTTASFSLNLYSEQDARTMAHGWCHRMHYFYTLWQSVGVPGYRFTDQDVASYRELPQFAELARAATGVHLARVLKIRAVQPS